MRSAEIPRRPPRKRGRPPLSPPPRSLATANCVHHLGASDPTKMELTRLGWENEQLI
jgi:hypothetical protein